MTFADRFKKTRKAKKLSQNAVARHLGISRNAVSLWESGTSTPAPDRMAQVAVLLGKPVDWLATGRSGVSVPVEGLPLRGDIAAGVWFEVHENQEAEVERVPVAPDPRYPIESQYALRVRGNSVNRIAKDGTILAVVDLITGGIEPRPGDLVWVERRRGQLVEATVKRLKRGGKGLELWPESDDPAYQDKIAVRPPKGDGEVEIRGLIIRVITEIPRGE